MLVVVRNNDVKQAVMALRRKLAKDGSLKELADRALPKASDRRRQKADRARRRLKKKRREIG